MFNVFAPHKCLIIEVQIEKKSGKKNLKVYGDISYDKSELSSIASELNRKYWEFNNSKYTRYSKTWHVVDLGG